LAIVIVALLFGLIEGSTDQFAKSKS